jgi:hypothetical protein
MVHRLLLAVLLPVLLAGCSSSPALRRAVTPAYKPANVYQAHANLPPHIRRVAVLPIPRSRDDAHQAAGASLLEPVLLSELGKRGLFEVTPVSLEQMRALVGEGGWAAEDALPHDFLERLLKLAGADAVLFTSLTTYQPYPPLRVGWKLRLVDGLRKETWWSIDEVFDAGNLPVTVAAEDYARAELNLPNPLLDNSSVLHSPRRFGQYTAHAVAATLPAR